MTNKLICTLIMSTFLTAFTVAQPSLNRSSSEIKQELDKLNIVGTVLYIAAHPDDENTAVLSYMNSEKLLRTGYLSLTRGDGGQNLIGSEQAELLGVIRTQELLEARRIDGAEQFFTRAIDFGYSKSANETFQIWDKQMLLSDVVFIIRKFQPDVIITRFPTTGEGGHGQHTASAILALEAFALAGDKNSFPEQLKDVETWQPKRIFWNGWLPTLEANKTDLSKLLQIDVGAYNNLLGKSYTEIAALSRSMHKSQGFGATGRRGENLNHFIQLGGDNATTDLFEGIDLTWKRVSGSDKVQTLIAEAINNFDHKNPASIIPSLFNIYSELQQLEQNTIVKTKILDVKKLISYCSGLWIEAIAKDYMYSPGATVQLTAGVVNRSSFPLTLNKIVVKPSNKNIEVNQQLDENKFLSFDSGFQIDENSIYSQPYWLNNKPGKGLFNFDDSKLLANAENLPALSCDFYISNGKEEITLNVPVLYRRTDPVEGEKYRSVEIVPPATIKFDDKLLIFTENKKKEITISVKTYFDALSGKLKFKIPTGWKVEPSEINFQLNKKYDEEFLKINITPPQYNSNDELIASVETNFERSSYSMKEINYPHIKPQLVLSESEIKLIKLDLPKSVNRIGYIMGSGDDVPVYLSQLGYNVELISDEQLDNGSLSQYDVILTGIRAYNTRQRLGQQQNKLLKYVESGGTLIVQYNVDRGLVTDKLSPFAITFSRTRVTDENSKTIFNIPDHRLLNYPNKITEEDFNDWVQERGLYFANEWDTNFASVISFSDPGELPAGGGLLYSKYGSGVFIYTGISWWRQLPAGVTGAYRLFVNLLSAGVEKHSLK